MCPMFLASSYVFEIYVLAGVNVKFVLFRDGASCSLMGRCVRTYTASLSIRNLDYVDYYYYFLWHCSRSRTMASSSTKFLDYIQRRATVGRTPNFVDYLRKLLITSQLLMNCFLKILPLPLSIRSFENILRLDTVELFSVCFM
jgi:hypothetical protein